MTSELDCPPELTVRNAYKVFAPQVILRGLNMTVPQCSIYTLLGPSGCGKTTLFKCIIGRQNLDFGDIVVRSRHHKSIGYMPQDLCLYHELSIKETLVYYGMLFGMSLEDIARRTKELVDLLQLPSPDHVIDQMSGGQQRRVSLSVALFHNPEFLILDEPTVGLDPEIIKSIWDYFHYLVVIEKKTILITTHYIEEARQGDMVGIMRKGVLLAEESPQVLLDYHGCETLEQVFLNLCNTQSTSQSTQNTQRFSHISRTVEKRPPPLLKSNSVQECYQRIKAQNQKNVFLMARNSIVVIFIFVVSILSTALFNVVIGHNPEGLHVGYINDEFTKEIPQCSLVPLESCSTEGIESHLSCRFMNALENKGVILTEFKTIDEGIHAVRKNYVSGIMYFSSNYTKAYFYRLYKTVHTEEEIADLSEVKMWLDMSDKLIGTVLQRKVYSAFAAFQNDLYRDCGWNEKASNIPPIKFHDAIHGSNVEDFTADAVPGLLALAQFVMALFVMLATLLVEKKDGVLDRNLVAGLNFSEMIISHIFIQFIFLVFHTGFIVLVNYGLFSNPMNGSWVLFICLLIAIGISGLFCGLFLSALSNSNFAASMFGTGVFLMSATMCGIIWPTEAMHYLIKPLSAVMPLTFPIQAYRSIAFRGWSFNHFTVYMGFVTCGLCSVSCILATAVLTRWMNVTSPKN